jgi:catechol 2,3-dioxygenase-like lactoylglutathione lyase family enzyme
MLATSPIVAFVATTDPSRAKAFYRDVLGLLLISEDEYALVFDAHGTMLRVAIVGEIVLAPYTVLGWQVDDIDATVRGLVAKGVKFEHYAWMEKAMEQNDLGIWSAPSGAKVAWFKDPDGNLLSVSRH